MQFNPLLTELTTAATDLLMMFVALACLNALWGAADGVRARLWMWTIGLLGQIVALPVLLSCLRAGLFPAAARLSLAPATETVSSGARSER